MSETMRERIAAGKLFTDYVEGLPEDRTKCKLNLIEFNNSLPTDIEGRMKIAEKLFGKKVRAWIEPPFYCCYGYNIHFEGPCYINFNCNFVDDGIITVGEGTMFGPGVTIATVGHPLRPDMREYMYCSPVTFGKNCWIGENATICPGVTIGDNSVIGAGSVVTKDIPANVIAVGNPARVLRAIDERDKKYYYKNLEITAEDLEEERKLEAQ